MKKIPKSIKIGTKVKLDASDIWYVVDEIISNIWVKVRGLCGHFQYGHILKYTNK